MPTFMDDPEYDQALSFLLERIDYERSVAVPYRRREYRLARMRELLRRIGHPERGQRIVHIAGTKGKGSTAAMLAAMLTSAGYRVGLFTSPHLERLEERFSIGGVDCPKEIFCELVNRLRPVVGEMDRLAQRHGELGPTYFELTTAIALLYFAEAGVDFSVLEVGMGGRLDSTNVCRPCCCAITTISYDHTRQLGSTLEAIAGEKAGIIKPGIPVVSGVEDASAAAVIHRIAEERGAPLVQVAPCATGISPQETARRVPAHAACVRHAGRLGRDDRVAADHGEAKRLRPPAHAGSSAGDPGGHTAAETLHPGDEQRTV